ncbi:MAG TPA: hypothetical protein VIJ93_05990 [bacterium]
MSNRWKFILLFLLLLAFRFAFGLSQPFFTEDELQTYLVGLKCYTTGTWPYFGPDLIVTETGFYNQIPGALEGLLIGLPLRVLPVPESPIVLLNLLSLSGLAFLAWYITRRLPELSFPFVITWLALLPWTLHESTNILNEGYILFGSCLFFVGFLEALPSLSLRWLSPGAAFGLMGFGLFWNMQFHFSWVLLPLFILGAFLWRWKKGELGWAREILGFITGSALPLALLIPTFIKFGISKGGAGAGTSVGFNRDNFCAFFTILARYFSFPAFEMPRFIALSSTTRWEFLTDNPWLFLPGVFLTLLGLIQPFVLLIYGWFKDPRHKDAQFVQRLALAGFLWVWVSFWFTSKPPMAHIYFILFPLVGVYSFYVWSRFAPKRGWRLFAAVCIVASLWFQSGYLWQMMKVRSVYVDRAKVVRAIQEKDYHLLGERRLGSLY